jgi:hypothetical protein
MSQENRLLSGFSFYTVCSNSCFTEKKSNKKYTDLLRTVIRVEICLNVLKHVSMLMQEWEKELVQAPSQCSLELHFCNAILKR